jgi:predicted porin
MGQWTTPWADLDALWSIGTVGGWGPVTSIIGRRETTGVAPNPFCANTIPVPAAGAAICDAVEAAGGVGHPFWRRVSNAVFYQSPVINGLQGKFAYQTNEGRANNGATSAAFGSTANPSLISVSAQWSGMGGAARIGCGYDKHSEFSAAKKSDTGMTVKGGYDFGVFDLGLAYESMTYQTPVNILANGGECGLTNTAVALSVPIGSGFVRGSWSKASDMNDVGCGPAGTPISPAGSFVGANGATEVNIGYEHRFSKRTTIGVGYARIDNDALGTHNWTGLPPSNNGAANGPATGQDVSTFFVNMIHRF